MKLDFCAAFTSTVVELDLVESAADVAVTVTAPDALASVKSPAPETLPAEAVHVTELSKLPVPCTVATLIGLACLQDRVETGRCH